MSARSSSASWVLVQVVTVHHLRRHRSALHGRREVVVEGGGVPPPGRARIAEHVGEMFSEVRRSPRRLGPAAVAVPHALYVDSVVLDGRTQIVIAHGRGLLVGEDGSGEEAGMLHRRGSPRGDGQRRHGARVVAQDVDRVPTEAVGQCDDCVCAVLDGRSGGRHEALPDAGGVGGAGEPVGPHLILEASIDAAASDSCEGTPAVGRWGSRAARPGTGAARWGGRRTSSESSAPLGPKAATPHLSADLDDDLSDVLAAHQSVEGTGHRLQPRVAVL